ncbi:hypothetical protein G5S35_22305 [Paraburkholderia tropica]|uniref:hypothetical protein n=1 Tax=Paraburkholderia tropica TaxID=92647 RepID=UPI0016029E59|nr:hypothetical protein [Paraburkholderia tropica]QNB14273.1 hypothetical protein G5S35_22305 [Paraburkholderia tropica]
MSVPVGFKHERGLCPHCNFEGAKGHMRRYHFDNCKYRFVGKPEVGQEEVKPEPVGEQPVRKGPGRPKVSEGGSSQRFMARVLKEHAQKYQHEIAQFISDRGLDAVWDLKFGNPRASWISIEFKKDGLATQLERYVVSLVNKDTENPDD